MSDTETQNYWSKILGQANVIVSGASEAEMAVQLFDVLEEFFDGSNCWRETIDFTVTPNAVSYPLYPTSGRVLRLNNVVDQHGTPQQAVMPEIGTVRFLYPFSDQQPMTATVIKTVTDPFNCSPPHIPEWVLPVHGRGILSGLVGNLFSQPGQSYSNPRMANFSLMRFRDYIAHARVAAMKANTIGTQAWTFPQQFRVSGQRGGVSTFNVHPTHQLR